MDELYIEPAAIYVIEKGYVDLFRLFNLIHQKRAFFVTRANNFELPSITISELYRERWNVELFFKWIKQRLKIKSFYGTTRNAFYSQIWIAICTYLLIATAKKKMHIGQSLYTFSQTLGLTLFEKMPINEIFNKTATERISDDHPMLFSFSDF